MTDHIHWRIVQPVEDPGDTLRAVCRVPGCPERVKEYPRATQEHFGRMGILKRTEPKGTSRSPSDG